ncbi:MAG: hypothetical protein JWO84_557 [Parcubacteria group bacterium]|nr:hypothetical protein [Parcubacteria group bacterium]
MRKFAVVTIVASVCLIAGAGTGFALVRLSQPEPTVADIIYSRLHTTGSQMQQTVPQTKDPYWWNSRHWLPA